MATTVAFGSNVIVDEILGNVWLEITRSGDLSVHTSALIFEDWNNSSASTDDIVFNPHIAGSNITYMSSSRSVQLNFVPGEKSVKIPYSISNDNIEEVSERLNFQLVGASTGTTIGDGDAYIKINANDAPIGLRVSNAGTVNEGGYAVFTISLSAPSNTETDFWVSTLYDSASAANGDYRGIVDERHTIPPGVTSVTISVRTYADSVINESTERFFLSVDQVVGNNVFIDDSNGIAYINDTTVIPTTLSVMDAGSVNEGDWATFTVKLNQPATENITFNYATYYGIYDEANAGGSDADYHGQPNGIGIIETGMQEMNIFVQTYGDNLVESNERFALRVDQITQGSASISDSTGYATIVDMTVSPAEPPPPEVTETPLTVGMLTDHARLFSNLETEVGASSAAAIIAGNKELSSVGKTLDFFGLLSNSIKNAITWFAGSEAYANEEDLPLFTQTEREINIGLRLQSRIDSDQVAVDPIHWTTAEVNDTNGLGLRAGDYVDGRLVIHQPWMALDAGGNYINTNSVQGRYTPNDPSMFSHESAFRFSMDWSPVNGMYMVAPLSGVIVDSEHMLSSDTNVFGAGNLGNFVTIKLDETTKDGKSIYITYGHLKQETNQLFNVGDVVKTGQIIGVVGDTGGYLNDDGVFQHYVKHAHITTETQVRESVGNDGIKGSIAGIVNVDERKANNIPPVYILGFNKDNTGSFSDLGVTGGGEQDYGLPMGDYDSSYGDTKQVATNIYPTIPAQHFIDLNFGAGGDYVIPDDDSAGGSGSGTTNPDTTNGTTGNDILVASDGDDVYNAGTGFDEIQYLGENSKLDNFAFETRTDGALLIGSSAFGSDITYGLEAAWFEASNQWFLINDLLNLPPATTGTWGDDVFVAATGNRAFFSLTGFDEIQYLGPYSLVENFVFIRESGNVTKAISTAFGEQILYDMEGVWLDASNQWNLIDDLLTEVANGTIGDDVAIASDGNDVYYGDTGFDELQFFGIHASQDQFTFTKLTDGGVVVSSEAYGTDVLYGVEAVYFDASGQWSLTDNLFL